MSTFWPVVTRDDVARATRRLNRDDLASRQGPTPVCHSTRYRPGTAIDHLDHQSNRAPLGIATTSHWTPCRRRT